MSKVRSHRSQVVSLAAASLVAASLAGFLGSRIVALRSDHTGFWMVFLPLLLVVAFGFAAMLPWWRKLDDLQKSGQLNAWFWGGQVGGFVVLVALVAATGQRSDASLGALALLLGEVAGFALVWLWWRMRSHGPAE